MAVGACDTETSARLDLSGPCALTSLANLVEHVIDDVEFAAEQGTLRLAEGITVDEIDPRFGFHIRRIR